jgi:hypothetical protein
LTTRRLPWLTVGLVALPLAAVLRPQGWHTIAFSRDGTKLASGRGGGEVLVWDVAAVLAWKPGKK